jgi:aminomethyltransferase
METMELSKTPLYTEHVLLKAKMAAFGGWDMPIQYEGILAEHGRTRREVTLFDISHMGELLIQGDCEAIGLEQIFTMRLRDMPIKTSRYGVMCNDAGGVIDDCIMFRVERDRWYLVVNGATIEKDVGHIRERLAGRGELIDVSFLTGKLDLQGPLARDVLTTFNPDIGRLAYFTFDYFDMLGEKALVSRTGYTGELGYEIFYPWGKTVDLWRALLSDKRVAPAGLGARDVLRLEKGYSLYGHELGEDRTPLESGLGRFIDWDKEFIGKEALTRQKEKGVRSVITGIQSMNRRAPREGHRVFDERRRLIGTVTSGCFSPCLNRGIALAMIDADFAKPGFKILFGEREPFASGTTSERVFYRGGSIKA